MTFHCSSALEKLGYFGYVYLKRTQINSLNSRLHLPCWYERLKLSDSDQPVLTFLMQHSSIPHFFTSANNIFFLAFSDIHYSTTFYLGLGKAGQFETVLGVDEVSEPDEVVRGVLHRNVNHCGVATIVPDEINKH